MIQMSKEFYFNILITSCQKPYAFIYCLILHNIKFYIGTKCTLSQSKSKKNYDRTTPKDRALLQLLSASFLLKNKILLEIDTGQVGAYSHILMLEALKSKYHLRAIDSIAEQRIESSFDITKPLALMQQGLPAAYDFSDYVYVLDESGNADKLANLGNSFRQDLAALLINNFKDYIPSVQHLRSIPEIPQLLISTFDTEVWNRISTSIVPVYKPAWNDGSRSKILSPNFAQRKRDFFKFDVKMLFQIKKNVKGSNPLTASL